MLKNEIGIKLSATGMNTKPCIIPITIVNQIVLKKVRIIYASTVYKIDMPAIVDVAPCKGQDLEFANNNSFFLTKINYIIYLVSSNKW